MSPGWGRRRGCRHVLPAGVDTAAHDLARPLEGAALDEWDGAPAPPEPET